MLPVKIINGKRHYISPDGTPLPSVTTVLASIPNPDLDAWRASVGEEVADYIKTQASIRGTVFHQLIEEYLSPTSVSVLRKKYPKLLPFALFENILPILDEIKNIACRETVLWSTDLRIAGKVDCIAEYDGVESVIDFKTATKAKRAENILNYFLQTTAYSLMYLERHKIDIPQIVVIISCESGEKQVFVRDRADYEATLREVCANYHRVNSPTI